MQVLHRAGAVAQGRCPGAGQRFVQGMLRRADGHRRAEDGHADVGVLVGPLGDHPFGLALPTANANSGLGRSGESSVSGTLLSGQAPYTVALDKCTNDQQAAAATRRALAAAPFG